MDRIRAGVDDMLSRRNIFIKIEIVSVFCWAEYRNDRGFVRRLIERGRGRKV